MPRVTPKVIGISGCTRCGKGTLAAALQEELGGAKKVAVLCQDNFATSQLARKQESGWESTGSIDHGALRRALEKKRTGSHQFVIVEGFRAFHDPELVAMMDHLVWLELSREVCYKRRMATTRVSEQEFAYHLWPCHEEYRQWCFSKGPMAVGAAVGAAVTRHVLNGEKAPATLLQGVLNTVRPANGQQPPPPKVQNIGLPAPPPAASPAAAPPPGIRSTTAAPAGAPGATTAAPVTLEVAAVSTRSAASAAPGTTAVSTTTAQARRKSRAKLDAVLAALPEGACVAVVTMLGSLCPITVAHVQAFVEARRLLLGEPSAARRPEQLEAFDACVGLVSLNGDSYVGSKLRQKGQVALKLAERRALVELASDEYPWLAWEEREGDSLEALAQAWPQLSFIHFYMNGADDVVRHRKYAWAGLHCRMITMGRAGDTVKVLEGARRAGVDLEQGYFVMGPELPDISATEVRRALTEGDRAAAEKLLHPKVLAWCEQHAPWK